MWLAVHGEGCLKHKSGDLIFSLKLGLPLLQLLGSEVRLHMSDLDVRMISIQ